MSTAAAPSASAWTEEGIYQRMVQTIRNQQLHPGTKLGEDRLASAFGVSRTRIRPVLARLASEQVVTITPNRGATVAPAKTETGGFIGKLFGKSASTSNGIDLDIGCLFETTGGAKSAVQALGNSWGAYERPPYIHLEGDDRSGSVSSGENLYINGAHFDQIKRVLVYAFIYQGVPNWAATDAIVTIEIPGQPPVEVRLDNGSNQSMCAIAMLDNQGGNLQVTKLVEYFGGQGKKTAHQLMDERYSFGLNWSAGTKD